MSEPSHIVDIHELLVDRGADHGALRAELEHELARLLSSPDPKHLGTAAPTRAQRIALAVYEQMQQGERR